MCFFKFNVAVAISMSTLQPALYPIQLLNEANLQGLFWQHSTTGDEKNQVFTATVKHNGNDYSGSGNSLSPLLHTTMSLSPCTNNSK